MNPLTTFISTGPHVTRWEKELRKLFLYVKLQASSRTLRTGFRERFDGAFVEIENEYLLPTFRVRRRRIEIDAAFSSYFCSYYFSSRVSINFSSSVIICSIRFYYYSRLHYVRSGLLDGRFTILISDIVSFRINHSFDYCFRRSLTNAIFFHPAGNHFVWEFMPDFHMLNVNPSAGFLHHYRVSFLSFLLLLSALPFFLLFQFLLSFSWSSSSCSLFSSSSSSALLLRSVLFCFFSFVLATRFA